MKALALLLLVITLILLVADLSIQKPSKLLCPGKPCNVIFIVIDTLGAKHLGIYGYDRETSPYIDSFFSKNTLLFKNAFSNATWTNPSFASFLTSQYASEIPVTTWEDKIPQDTPNFVKILRKSDVDVKLVTEKVSYSKEISADQSVFEQNETTFSEQNLLFHSASEWLVSRKNESRPFFLMIHNWTVHGPYDSPDKYRNFFTTKGPTSTITNEEIVKERQSLLEATRSGKPIQTDFDHFRLPYDQEIRYLDDQLKDFFEAIPKEILDSSIIIFTGDHGEAFGEHNLITHSIKPYQEVIHVPLLIRSPGQTGKTINLNVSLLDLAPTILDIYGLTPPQQFKGSNLWELIKDPKNNQRILRSEFTVQKPLRIYFNDPNRFEKLKADTIFTKILGNWKLLNDESSPQLYNLKDDPEEQNNMMIRLSEIKAEDKKSIDMLFNEFGIPIN